MSDRDKPFPTWPFDAALLELIRQAGRVWVVATSGRTDGQTSTRPRAVRRVSGDD
jgi:hypothetical protein